MQTLRLMPWQLSVVQLPVGDGCDWAKSGAFHSITQTPDELSVVCETSCVPQHLPHEAGWSALTIDAILDFTMVGILAKLSGILAAANISIFAISTYNTDYILLKSAYTKRALESLAQNGYNVIIDA